MFPRRDTAMTAAALITCRGSTDLAIPAITDRSLADEPCTTIWDTSTWNIDNPARGCHPSVPAGDGDDLLGQWLLGLLRDRTSTQRP